MVVVKVVRLIALNSNNNNNNNSTSNIIDKNLLPHGSCRQHKDMRTVKLCIRQNPTVFNGG